jgi:hypothetical protein
MTRSSSAFLLQRAYEHATASAGALALTVLMVLTVDARAAGNRVVTHSVSIEVPTVSIEVPTVTIEEIRGGVEG